MMTMQVIGLHLYAGWYAFFSANRSKMPLVLYTIVLFADIDNATTTWIV